MLGGCNLNMLILYSLAFSPVIVAFAFYAYGTLKLPKQDAKDVRDFMYRSGPDGTVQPLVIGHRGGQFEAPENTLQAMRSAYRNGATAVELDLDFTLDKVPIIIHDDTVDRTTDGKGPIASMTYKEIKSLNAASKAKKLLFSDGNHSETTFEAIPTLEEAVNLSIGLGMKIILDVKSNPTMTANALKNLGAANEKIYDHVMVTSFYPDILYSVRKADSKFLTGLIWRFQHTSRTVTWKPKYSGVQQWLYEAFELIYFYLVHTLLPDFLGVSVVSMHKDHMSMRYLRQWRSNGIEVMAWTVNDPLEKEYFLKYYKVPIITDSILNLMDCPEQSD